MISAHFSREEMACKDGCGFDTADIRLVEVLEAVREHFNAPVIITSGCRCAKHNASVGGSVNSQHKYGRAADFYVQGYDPAEVYEWLDRSFSMELGLGLYKNWLHCDSRESPARWRG